MASDHTEADLQYKVAHRQPTIRAAFYWYTGEAPNLAPGDTRGARRYLAKLEQARNACKPLTSSEHTRLTRLIRKWTRRANGQDPRFMVMGTRKGSPTETEKQRMYRLGWCPTYQPKPEPRNLSVKPCRECRRRFTPTRQDQIFCSPWCRQQYWQAIYRGETRS